MAKKKSKRDKKRSKKDRKKSAEKAARKATKSLKQKSAKARRKTAKKAAKKAVKRPKAAKKTARKAAKKVARRPKSAKKKTARKAVKRPKAAKPKSRVKAAPKAAKPKSPAPSAAKPIAPVATPAAPKPIAPAAAPSAPRPVAPAAKPAVPVAAPKPSVPSKPDVRPIPAPPPTPAPPKPEVTFIAGHFDPGIERYYSMLAQNTPESHRLGTLQVDRILATNPKDMVALAEKAHDIVNNWRNDVLSEETIKECQLEFATGDPFACAHKWAQRSIDSGNARGIANPYGYWARAYVHKYERKANQSAADYKTALSFPPKAFIGHVGRRRKDLIVEWLEGLVYWARQDQLQRIVDKIDSDAPAGAGKLEGWINWVKCFALHLAGKFDASNALYPDYLPDDRDVNLIIAANHARLGHEDQRQLHRKLFLEKAGNANWSAAKEIERSPFTDKAMRDFWHESVDKALRAPSAAPAPSI
jgi:hypothetical protein